MRNGRKKSRKLRWKVRGFLPSIQRLIDRRRIPSTFTIIKEKEPAI